MNTASEPYRSALLITTWMSYSRYFSTAMAPAAHKHNSDRWKNTSKTAEFSRNVAINITSTSTAAAANHFSCSRSSPTERANRTTTAATLTASAASSNENTAASKGVSAWTDALNGSDQ